MKIREILTEAKDVFPDVDVIKLDPDRADAYDVVQSIIPTLIRIAYTNLVNDKQKYERTHTDKEDISFEFTKGALEEEVDKLIKHITNRFDDLSSHDKLSYIDRIKSEFKEKLEEQ
jgi:hypothetical protein